MFMGGVNAFFKSAKTKVKDMTWSLYVDMLLIFYSIRFYIGKSIHFNLKRNSGPCKTKITDSFLKLKNSFCSYINIFMEGWGGDDLPQKSHFLI